MKSDSGREHGRRRIGIFGSGWDGEKVRLLYNFKKLH